MITRREAITLLGSISAGMLAGPSRNDLESAASLLTARVRLDGPTPRLAPGAPNSPERLALIEKFRASAEGVEQKFEARELEADGVMPYRLFRPEATGGRRLPLVVYLHGSGGLGTDNVKQMGAGNIFGTRVWALPENQARFPAYVVAPQTDRGWTRYAPQREGETEVKLIPGLGDGARLAFAVIDALRRELPVDDQRIYLVGQSMGGGGVWHMTAHRPRFFAAAVACCGVSTLEPAVDSARTPIWNFHGGADETVPVSLSRDRIAALRKAGGHPIATEYAGVGHNVWQWAFTEPALLEWVFAKRRKV